MCGRLTHLTFLVLVLSLVLAGQVSAELVAHWKLDDGSGTVAIDSSGNGHDGTLMGDPQWVAGKSGGALEFNGSSDYVEVPFSESLRVLNQGDFSFAAWFSSNSSWHTLRTSQRKRSVCSREPTTQPV